MDNNTNIFNDLEIKIDLDNPDLMDDYVVDLGTKYNDGSKKVIRYKYLPENTAPPKIKRRIYDKTFKKFSREINKINDPNNTCIYESYHSKASTFRAYKKIDIRILQCKCSIDELNRIFLKHFQDFVILDNTDESTDQN